MYSHDWRHLPSTLNQTNMVTTVTIVYSHDWWLLQWILNHANVVTRVTMVVFVNELKL
jgi:hypothetical protein